MKGLQDVVDAEKKDWGEQLALLKDTVTNLEDLQTARSQISGIKLEISGLRQEIGELKKTLQQNQKPRSDDMSDMSKKTYAASNQSAILALICVVMIIANLAIGCWNLAEICIH